MRSPGLTPPEFLIGGVHLTAKVGGINSANQLSTSRPVSQDLAELEDGSGHCQTVLVGDFNMHPYDPGMIGNTGIHALMTLRLAEKSRKSGGDKTRRFYNPMWGHFGLKFAPSFS